MTRKFEEMAREFVSVYVPAWQRSMRKNATAELLDLLVEVRDEADRAATERAARVLMERSKALVSRRDVYPVGSAAHNEQMDRAAEAIACADLIRSTLDKKEGEDDAG